MVIKSGKLTREEKLEGYLIDAENEKDLLREKLHEALSRNVDLTLERNELKQKLEEFKSDCARYL